MLIWNVRIMLALKLTFYVKKVLKIVSHAENSDSLQSSTNNDTSNRRSMLKRKKDNRLRKYGNLIPSPGNNNC
jgi:hypothetical protein